MRIRAAAAVLVTALLGAGVFVAVTGAASPAGASTTGNYLVTFYGYPDNSPPGAQIAYPQNGGNPTIHNEASGVGTYADPVTFATDKSEIPVGTRIYVPFVHRYFIMEDDCTECDEDWTGSGPDGGPGMHHVDLWTGGAGGSSSAVINCEDNLTQNSAQVIVDPPASEPVDTTPLFNSGDNSCYNPSDPHLSTPSTPTPTPSPKSSPTPKPSPRPAPTQPGPPLAVTRPVMPPPPLPQATPAPTQPTGKSEPNVSADAYAAVTGYGCQATPAADFHELGWWLQGLDGFLRINSGSPSEPGCDGAYTAMPMSGSATSDDNSNFAVWTFHTSPVTTGTCHIDVYVPDDPSIVHVGGDPAVYQVYDAAWPTGTPLGSFDIDQHFNSGRWASRHNWPVTNGVLTVKLDSRGIDWSGNTETHAHIAVSDISVTCAP
jgi:hypothetical protein